MLSLVSQGLDSESDEDDGDSSNSYFTETSFHLRKIIEVPSASGDDAKLLGKARAEVMQKLLDEQVVRLALSNCMLKFLHWEIRDPLPCKKSDRQHVRRLMELLLHNLDLDGKIHETDHTEDTVIFEVIEGTRQPLAAPGAPAVAISSQLSFQSGMVMPQQVNDVGKC